MAAISAQWAINDILKNAFSVESCLVKAPVDEKSSLQHRILITFTSLRGKNQKNFT
jgi:hypothetical protein